MRNKQPYVIIRDAQSLYSKAIIHFPSKRNSSSFTAIKLHVVCDARVTYGLNVHEKQRTIFRRIYWPKNVYVISKEKITETFSNITQIINKNAE